MYGMLGGDLLNHIEFLGLKAGEKYNDLPSAEAAASNEVYWKTEESKQDSKNTVTGSRNLWVTTVTGVEYGTLIYKCNNGCYSYLEPERGNMPSKSEVDRGIGGTAPHIPHLKIKIPKGCMAVSFTHSHNVRIQKSQPINNKELPIDDGYHSNLSLDDRGQGGKEKIRIIMVAGFPQSKELTIHVFDHMKHPLGDLSKFDEVSIPNNPPKPSNENK